MKFTEFYDVLLDVVKEMALHSFTDKPMSMGLVLGAVGYHRSMGAKGFAQTRYGSQALSFMAQAGMVDEETDEVNVEGMVAGLTEIKTCKDFRLPVKVPIIGDITLNNKDIDFITAKLKAAIN